MDVVDSVEGEDTAIEEGSASKVRMVVGTVDEEVDEGAMTTTTVVEVVMVDEVVVVEKEGSGAVDLIGVSHLPRLLSTKWKDNREALDGKKGEDGKQEIKSIIVYDDKDYGQYYKAW